MKFTVVSSRRAIGTLKIKSGSSTVRSYGLGRDTNWDISFNGRRASGKLLPEGRYAVVLTLKGPNNKIKSAKTSILVSHFVRPKPTPYNTCTSADPYRVCYEISAYGTRSEFEAYDGSLTYATPSGTSQGDADDGWWDYYDFSPGDFLYLSVQSHVYGGVTCRIIQGGDVISENSAYGFAAIADCEGRA